MISLKLRVKLGLKWEWSYLPHGTVVRETWSNGHQGANNGVFHLPASYWKLWDWPSAVVNFDLLLWCWEWERSFSLPLSLYPSHPLPSPVSLGFLALTYKSFFFSNKQLMEIDKTAISINQTINQTVHPTQTNLIQNSGCSFFLCVSSHPLLPSPLFSSFPLLPPSFSPASLTCQILELFDDLNICLSSKLLHWDSHSQGNGIRKYL